MTCPDENSLLEFAEGLLDSAGRTEIEQHLDHCEPCLESVCHAATQDDRLGTDIGRYVIVDVLGRGSMGVVYRAFDPELDRSVAVKVIPPGLSGRVDDRLRAQLVREAKALAGLSHPNILAVYDAGLSGRGLFVATEFVAGGDLRVWLRERRTPAVILRVFYELADGLAAAHDAGIIHRDIKPENLLLDANARPRLADFGLASFTPSPSSLNADRGAGTMAYMAPEQLDGAPADARSDQFAFCVTVFEALFGSRPFAGDTVDALRRQQDQPLLMPARAGVPRRVRRVLRRGLSVDPLARFESMRAVRTLLRPRAQPRVASLAIVTIGAALATMVWMRDDQRCTGAAEALAPVGGAPQRALVDRQLTAAGATPAATARIDATLSEFAAQWVAAHDEACRATAIREERSAETLALTVTCLAGARRQLQAVTTVLAGADAQTVGAAERVVASLPSLQACSDLEALQIAAPPVSEANRADYDIAMQHFDQVTRWLLAGSVGEARAEHDAARIVVERSGFLPLQTFVKRYAGDIALYAGQWGTAEALYRETLALATEHEQRGEVARAATQLVLVVGVMLSRDAEGLVYAEFARAVAPNDIARFDIESNVAKLQLARGDFVEAEATIQRTLASDLAGVRWVNRAALRGDLLELYRKTNQLQKSEPLARAHVASYRGHVDEHHPDLALAHARLAAILTKRGEVAEAASLFQRALADLEGAWGESHPTVAAVRSAYASALVRLGRYVEAKAENQRALAAMTAGPGPDSHDAIAVRTNLALVQSTLGEVEESAKAYESILAAAIQKSGLDDPDAATIRGNLGHQLLVLGRVDEAIDQLQRALRVHRTQLGPDQARTALSEYKLARALRHARQWEQAEVHYRNAVAVDPTTISASLLSTYRTGLAGLLVERCRLAEARTQLHLDESLDAASVGRPRDRAHRAIVRAELLYREGGDASQARVLLSSARSGLAPGDRLDAEKIQRLLASPPAACPPHGEAP